MKVSVDTLTILTHLNDVAAKGALARILVLKATGRGESDCIWKNTTVDCFVVCPHNPVVNCSSHHHGN